MAAGRRSLLRLARPGHGELTHRLSSRGTTRDNYYYCRITGSGDLPWSSVLRHKTEWESPPCGAGYYALVQCLQGVQTSAWHPWGISISGTRTDTIDQCNRTPTWHPAIDGGREDLAIRW